MLWHSWAAAAPLKYASFDVRYHQHTDTHTQLLQRCSLSLHPIYGTVSTLYLLITYTSAIGGKYATCSDAFEDFISSRVNTSWWCCCCCVFFFYIFASSLIRWSRHMCIHFWMILKHVVRFMRIPLNAAVKCCVQIRSIVPIVEGDRETGKIHS